MGEREEKRETMSRPTFVFRGGRGQVRRDEPLPCAGAQGRRRCEVRAAVGQETLETEDPWLSTTTTSIIARSRCGTTRIAFSCGGLGTRSRKLTAVATSSAFWICSSAARRR